MHHSRAQIGARLQEERQRVGLTQGEFAEKIGVAKRTLAGYEAGTGEIGATALDAARLVGVDVLYVVSGIRAPTPESSLSEPEARLVEDFRKMRSADQGSAQRMVSALAETSAGYDAN
ncbi:helix-turn-helix domain-containing protein [Pseudomonas abyssi]|uniref:helix-turn-helix domain-containing protein n=1 Tax=Pseudomonas abyssi TaxID=170540 RepID=UPI001FEACAB7|nr:helix-turn-helix transcriptional regulator [Pseudomonas abyssi]